MKRFFAVAIVAAAWFATTTVAAPPQGRSGAFNFRLGGFVPTGNSDFWEYKETYYTFDHSDLNDVIVGIGYNAAVNNFFEVDVNADIYSSSVRSADGFYVDSDGYPILHDTRLNSVPLTVSFRVLPAGRFARRGAEGKHYVRRPVFYFGGGAGLAYWQYEE